MLFASIWALLLLASFGQPYVETEATRNFFYRWFFLCFVGLVALLLGTTKGAGHRSIWGAIYSGAYERIGEGWTGVAKYCLGLLIAGVVLGFANAKVFAAPTRILASQGAQQIVRIEHVSVWRSVLHGRVKLVLGGGEFAGSTLIWRSDEPALVGVESEISGAARVGPCVFLIGRRFSFGMFVDEIRRTDCGGAVSAR